MRLCLIVLIVLMLPLIAANAREFTTRVVAVVEGSDAGGDYVAYWAAGKLAPEEAYAPDAMRRMELALLNPALRPETLWETQRVRLLRQPPVVLPAMRFLGARHPAVGFMLCTLVEAFLLGALLAGTTRWRERTALEGVAWICLGLGWAPVWAAFHLARWSAVVAAVAFLAALAWLRQGDSRAAGLAFTGMLLHQLFWLLPLALFLGITRRFRALAGLGLGAAGLALASLWLLGAEGTLQYVNSVVDAPRNLYFADYDQMYNLRGLAERWLGDWPGLIVPAAAFCSLALWAGAALAWRRRPDSFAVLALALVLASPVTHAPDLLLLLPAAAAAPPLFFLAWGPWVWLSPWPALRSMAVLILTGVMVWLARRR